MKLAKLTALMLLGLGVAGCSAPQQVSRNESLQIPSELSAPITRSYDIQTINVTVPDELVVSEANGYYPMADIVWRGDDFGDRKVQVAQMLNEGFSAGVANMAKGEIPVVLNVTLERFHSLTERTRLTVGGVHSVRFVLTVVHAQTGAELEGPRVVTADLSAYGGMAAVVAERRGQTQKVRLTDHFAEVIQVELAPGGPV